MPRVSEETNRPECPSRRYCREDPPYVGVGASLAYAPGARQQTPGCLLQTSSGFFPPPLKERVAAKQLSVSAYWVSRWCARVQRERSPAVGEVRLERGLGVIVEIFSGTPGAEQEPDAT
jgi:hypothetical protein